LFGFGGEGGFQIFGVEVEFAGCDLFFWCAVEAKLADAESVVAVGIGGPQRRAENAAGHGARSVEVAEAGGGVEGGAGLVVGKVFEEVFARLVENAGAWVAGKIGSEAFDGLMGALADGGCALRVCGVEGGETGAEASRIQLRNGEDADAALCAPGSTEKPGARAAGRIGNGGVDDLHKP